MFDAGVRLRLPWPLIARARPYVLVGAGAAHVRTTTTFARSGAAVKPDALGIALGCDLACAATKPAFLVGGGALVPLTDRLFIDFGLRYDRMLARPSRNPGDTGQDATRLQIGGGVRF
jgi:opacity protein-like surface antigen